MIKKIFLFILTIAFSVGAIYCIGGAITDNYSAPDNKDHSFLNTLYVIGALVGLCLTVICFFEGTRKTNS